SSWAATTWSRRRTWTRRPPWPRASRPRAPARSRCGPSGPRRRPSSGPRAPSGGRTLPGGAMDFAALYRDLRPRGLGTLIRLLRDFDLAEDVLQEAFAAALVQWPRDGAPGNPCAWLVSTARHKALDRLRRQKSFAAREGRIAAEAALAAAAGTDLDEPFADDMLRLVFTCCHPALALEAQVALTLKTLCGLSVEEIARAFLVAPATMAQRLVRAKGKILRAHIPYEV